MIGAKLRELRTGRGLTLRELAAETGLSATLLSQIERGVTEPSLKSLRLVADVFGQSVSTLFDDGPVQAVHISRPGERSRITTPHGQVMYERLMPGNPQLAVLRGLLKPGESSSEEPWAHVAVECAFVVAGTLTVVVGDASHDVAQGEAITIDSRLPHRYCNNSNQQVEFILSVNPPTP